MLTYVQKNILLLCLNNVNQLLNENYKLLRSSNLKVVHIIHNYKLKTFIIAI